MHYIRSVAGLGVKCINGVGVTYLAVLCQILLVINELSVHYYYQKRES